MRNKNQAGASYQTVIGKDIRLEACVLAGKESVKVDGELVGDINMSGDLYIAENGNVTGNIRAGCVTIAGRVKGKIYCDSIVHITAKACVEAYIATQSLKTEEGASFNGQCLMLDEVTREVLKQSDIGDNKVFDFEKLGNTLIPDNGPPVAGLTD